MTDPEQIHGGNANDDAHHDSLGEKSTEDAPCDFKTVDSDFGQDEDDRVDPSAWWFASTMCPLLAGTLGPIASGFSICALVWHWREYIPPDQTELTSVLIPDPHWLVAINAVSLAFAIIGNFFLLMSMAQRLRFDIAQPITITGFLVAGLLLIADMAALTGLPYYDIKDPKAQPSDRHALTSGFYYAIWAAALYMIIGFMMCLTVWGANKRYYPKGFSLTPSQRTMMLQTMSFVVYLLLGALVFSTIEGWEYLDAVYWADVTLLTIGLGDISPATNVGKGLLFPFAIGGVLIVGLVIGSIRSLVLERGEEKMAARITESRREAAIHNVNERKHSIKVSWFSRAEFYTDSSLSQAQRREEEFDIMRKVQAASESERLYLGLFMSSTVALALWFVGAAIFTVTEKEQSWTYLDALYFAFTSLLTIGYGDYAPESASGRAFFVIWSLLAIPSLTILISNMGDTIVKWVSELTDFVASVTVLPGEDGFKRSAEHIVHRIAQSVTTFTPPGLLGMSSGRRNRDLDRTQHQSRLKSRIAARLLSHLGEQETEQEIQDGKDNLQRDIHFYHYILSRECRNLQSDLSDSTSKKYSWEEWEYYLKLMGDQDDFDNNQQPQALGEKGLYSSSQLRAQPTQKSESSANSKPADESQVSVGDGAKQGRRKTQKKFGNPEQYKKHLQSELDEEDALHGWSWLANRNPLISSKSETEWILTRLSAALENDLNRQRKGQLAKPPISYGDMQRAKGEGLDR